MERGDGEISLIRSESWLVTWPPRSYVERVDNVTH